MEPPFNNMKPDFAGVLLDLHEADASVFGKC
jgi:hypothetical protein